MIVTVIVVGPVAIFFSVCFIVFMVEANAVAKRKTVMRGHQIDRGAGIAARAFKHVAGCSKTSGKLAQRKITLEPKTSRCIAEMVIPLGKRRGEIPHLIPAFTNIPRFRNQLGA